MSTKSSVAIIDSPVVPHKERKKQKKKKKKKNQNISTANVLCSPVQPIVTGFILSKEKKMDKKLNAIDIS